jgi:hypothetical protein
MKKAIVSAALIVFSLIFMTSCANMTSSEAEEILRPLIESSHELNVIFFGEGLPTMTDEEMENDFTPEGIMRAQATNASYVPVTPESKYQTIQSLKEATEKIFTPAYAQVIYSLTMEGISSEFDESTGIESTILYARYIEDYGVLTASRNPDKFYTERTYDFTTLTVQKSSASHISATIMTKSEADESPISVRIQAIKTQTGWRLDSPTY